LAVAALVAHAGLLENGGPHSIWPEGVNMLAEELEFEKRKLEIEFQKLAIERSKLQWTRVSTIVPVVLAMVTIFYGVYSLRETAKDQLIAKLAEITFGTDPDSGAGKAAALAYLFSNELPKDLREKLTDSSALREQFKRHAGVDETVGSVDSKMDLLRITLERSPKETSRVINTWKAMFPGDSAWVDRFAEGLPKQ
jgi:hypothetical protein